MKRVLIYLFFLIVYQVGSSQIDIYNVIKEPTQDQKNSISKAQKNVQRADKMVDMAVKDYQKYAKFFQSKRKSKRRKGEKKTVNAKRNLISAASFYDRGYSSLYDVYYDYLSNLRFEFTEDQQQAENLMSDAEKKLEAGQVLLKIKNYSEKELKKSIQFKKLQSSIYKGRDYEKEAVLNLAKAIELYNNQEQKKIELERKDDEAWANALATNTISAYQNYINNFPNGKHVFEAKQKIQEIEEQIAQAEKQTNPNIIYRVQILADKRPWSTDEIKRRIYSQADVFYEIFYNGWYKYTIGEFSTYEEAKQFRDQVRQFVPGAFVIALTPDGEYIDDILKAISMEKQN